MLLDHGAVPFVDDGHFGHVAQNAGLMAANLQAAVADRRGAIERLRGVEPRQTDGFD